VARAQSALLMLASLSPHERVLDVACGTGSVAFGAAPAVGPRGRVLGVDVSGQMVEAARQRAEELAMPNVGFARMDGEKLDLPDACFDVALCALGLMYMPDPAQAVREMRRILRPGGRMVVAVWGERDRCGWSAVFPIVEAEVASDVCPLFFRLGREDALARLCADAQFEHVALERIASTLVYANADEACDAAFVGGPVALAWSRFDDAVRKRVRERYVEAIAPWCDGPGYRVPGEFVLAVAVAPGTQSTAGSCAASS
jgi:ubiquinone/menaquinone biosynthesis C-methylase UbiE